MSVEGRSNCDVALGRGAALVTKLRAIRAEAGFTLIEVLLAGVMLAILSVPISGLISTSAAIARLDRERTSADQLAQTQIETIRTLPYFDVGIVGRNPQGNVPATTSATLPSIGTVTITTQITYVADALPSNPYPTKADYKKVVLTVTDSAGKQLAQKMTYIAPASAPPNAGSTWDSIQRTVIDAVTNLALPGASVNLTGGPDTSPVTNRTDTTDASGSVLFPALDTTSSGTPGYTLATTLSGYSVFPDDISPGSPSSVASTVGVNSTGTIRMYKPTSLTVNVQTSTGAAYTSGATVSLDSSRCGLQTVSVPSGQSSVTITSCNPNSSGTVPLPPNVSGLTPLFASYYATAWSNSGGFWSPGTAVTVPSSYPTTLTQSVNVKFSATTFGTTKQIKVTVTKGGQNDTNARVEITGTPTGLSGPVYVFGTTNGSGQVTLTVPVVAASTTFTIYANDMGVQKQASTAPTVSLTTGSTSPATITVPIS
jgi:type II secretory pathway pseudopilin PulG